MEAGGGHGKGWVCRTLKALLRTWVCILRNFEHSLMGFMQENAMV